MSTGRNFDPTQDDHLVPSGLVADIPPPGNMMTLAWWCKFPVGALQGSYAVLSHLAGPGVLDIYITTSDPSEKKATIANYRGLFGEYQGFSQETIALALGDFHGHNWFMATTIDGVGPSFYAGTTPDNIAQLTTLGLNGPSFQTYAGGVRIGGRLPPLSWPLTGVFSQIGMWWGQALTLEQLKEFAGSCGQVTALGSSAAFYLPILGISPEPDFSSGNHDATVFGTTVVSGACVGGNDVGFLYAANVWNRALGEYEAKRLMYNPLQFYGANDLGGQVGGTAVPPVYPLPTVTLVATPASISAGFLSVLSWTSANADTLSIDQSIGSVVVPSGTFNVFPLVTTTYTITATNAFGVATASATVTVAAQGGGGGGGNRPPGVSPGAILQRDLSRTTDAGLGPGDNGTAYAAWAVIGSVVLTHPSELAMVLFITTEAIAAGSHPTVSVILDEIAPSVQVPFVSLGPYVPDPPVLVAAQTIYNDRFYISQTREPAVCRHLQTRFDWPAEAAANELLTWSVIGAHTEER